MASWCTHSLGLKTLEIIDFRTGYRHHLILTISVWVERVHSNMFLGMHLTDKLTPMNNAMTVIKRALQQIPFLCRLNKVDLPIPIPATTMFYRGTIESLAFYSHCEHRCLTAASAGHLHRALFVQSRLHRKGLHTSLSCHVHTHVVREKTQKDHNKNFLDAKQSLPHSIRLLNQKKWTAETYFFLIHFLKLLLLCTEYWSMICET